jgi:hypothetical protein
MRSDAPRRPESKASGCYRLLWVFRVAKGGSGKSADQAFWHPQKLRLGLAGILESADSALWLTVLS